MKEHQYTYYVTYSIKTMNGMGVGGLELFRNEKIVSYKDVKEVQSFIAEQNLGSSIVILDWKKLK